MRPTVLITIIGTHENSVHNVEYLLTKKKTHKNESNETALLY